MKESLSNRLTPLPFPALTPDTCRDEADGVRAAHRA